MVKNGNAMLIEDNIAAMAAAHRAPCSHGRCAVRRGATTGSASRSDGTIGQADLDAQFQTSGKDP
jgi:hypothetical protein